MSDTRSPTPSRKGIVAALVGATAIAGAGLAYGQAGGMFAYDPSQFPEIRGTLKQYTLSPRGDVDGLILADGTEVKVPPHLSAQIVFAVRPGDAVTVRGLRAKALPLVSAASVRNDASGLTVVDNGGPREERDRGETTLTGKVVSALHGARGEVNGVLLDSGLTVRLPPPEAARWDELMQPGRTLSARGVVNATLLGSVMDARAVGATPEQLTSTRPPKPPKGERGPKESREERELRRLAESNAFGQARTPSASLPPPGVSPPPAGDVPPPPAGVVPPPPAAPAPRP